MVIDEVGYLQQLLRLLPEGPVWSRDLDSVLAQVLKVPAASLARIDARANALFEDMDPRTTVELLVDWERNHGLPDECMRDIADPDQRRKRLHQKVAWEGGQSAPFFISLVEALGYEGATIDQFRPFRVNSPCNAGINQNGWRYAWRVNVPAEATVRRMTATSPCNSALGSWGDDTLLCILSGYKPAHTILYIAYGDFQ